MEEAEKVGEICRLNDRLRCQGLGGQTLLSPGVSALGPEVVSRILSAIGEFDNFTEDNDPHGEHDCAIVSVDGFRIIWKIDYYDEARETGSPDPANTEVTCRVLTIMLAEEY